MVERTSRAHSSPYGRTAYGYVLKLRLAREAITVSMVCDYTAPARAASGQLRCFNSALDAVMGLRTLLGQSSQLKKRALE